LKPMGVRGVFGLRVWDVELRGQTPEPYRGRVTHGSQRSPGVLWRRTMSAGRKTLPILVFKARRLLYHTTLGRE